MKNNYFDKNLIKELYPGAENMMYPPMLIHAATDKQLREACDSGEYLGQTKIDGVLYQFVKGHGGETYLFGRTVSKKTNLLTEKGANVPHIMEALDRLPNNTIILGEIFYFGGSSKNVVEIMGCLPEKAIERQNDKLRGKISFYIHDILMYDGVDFVKAKIDNETRYKILENIYRLHHLNDYWFLNLAKVWDDNLYNRIGQLLANGEEGMVLKKKTGIYEPGKRPLTNFKAKKVDTLDAVIIGFEEPTKEYYGKEIKDWQFWINPKTEERHPIYTYYNSYIKDKETYMPVTKAYYCRWSNSRIKIGAYDTDGKLVNIGTIHSGISDLMKLDMSKNPKDYYEKTCEIQCMELDKKEKTLRHGFFLRMREDKAPIECTIKNIFDV